MSGTIPNYHYLPTRRSSALDVHGAVRDRPHAGLAGSVARAGPGQGAEDRPPEADLHRRPRARLHPGLRALELSGGLRLRSEEHTSELSHLVISYAVFCLKKK